MFRLHLFSSYNNEETDEVMEYIQKLLENGSNLTESDIGVISPYKLQCTKISIACKRIGFENIQIGTSEIFQGQEKKVIILSTVVSRKSRPGSFLSNAQVCGQISLLTEIILFLERYIYIFHKSQTSITFTENECDFNTCTISPNHNWRSPYFEQRFKVV